MAKCGNCGVEYEAKRSTSEYCGPKCKQAFYRNRCKALSVTDVTVRPVTNVSVTDLEKCRYCGKSLPRLQEPRKYPGACYECAIKQPTPLIKDNELSSHPAIEFTGQMTGYEREYYKPASELGPNELNPVSRPGSEDHNGVCAV